MASSKQTQIKRAVSGFLFLVMLGLLIAGLIRAPDLHWGALVWMVVFVATAAIRTPFSLQTAKVAVSERRWDSTENAVLAAMMVSMMVLPLLYVGTPLLAFADYGLPDWATLIGVALQLPFIWLFWRSHVDLGLNWSPGLEVRETHSLVTRGVYRRMRHPMYAAIWLGVLGQPLILHNWLAGALVVPAFAALYVTRLPKEEAMMRERFGADYETYAARTGRVIPRFGSVPPDR